MIWGVGSGGCVVVAKLHVEGLHLFHADVVCSAKLQFVHGCGWVEVDVVGGGPGFEGECHTLQYHLLVKVWCADGGLAEVVDEGTQRLILFLSDDEEREG